MCRVFSTKHKRDRTSKPSTAFNSRNDRSNGRGNLLNSTGIWKPSLAMRELPSVRWSILTRILQTWNFQKGTTQTRNRTLLCAQSLKSHTAVPASPVWPRKGKESTTPNATTLCQVLSPPRTTGTMYTNHIYLHQCMRKYKTQNKTAQNVSWIHLVLLMHFWAKPSYTVKVAPHKTPHLGLTRHDKRSRSLTCLIIRLTCKTNHSYLLTISQNTIWASGSERECLLNAVTHITPRRNFGERFRKGISLDLPLLDDDDSLPRQKHRDREEWVGQGKPSRGQIELTGRQWCQHGTIIMTITIIIIIIIIIIPMQLHAFLLLELEKWSHSSPVYFIP